jgi:hypothetical protein
LLTEFTRRSLNATRALGPQATTPSWPPQIARIELEAQRAAMLERRVEWMLGVSRGYRNDRLNPRNIALHLDAINEAIKDISQAIARF